MRNTTFRPRRRCGTRLSVRAEGAERDFSFAPKGAERNFPLPRRRRGQSRNANFRSRRRRGTELPKKKPPEPKCGTRLFSFCQSAESDFSTFTFQQKKTIATFELVFLSIICKAQNAKNSIFSLSEIKIQTSLMAQMEA
jgi:hypothetical protein